jgi:nucleoside-diphosphate-sugar epimerase
MTVRALVCGAGGFIGGHLVQRLKSDGCWVRGVDLKEPQWRSSGADEFLVLDLRDPRSCELAVQVADGFDEVYQLAADMGGMGFIEAAECDIMQNNARIDLGVAHAAARAGVHRLFFGSSVCVYRDMHPDEAVIPEEDAYPAQPDNEYGWEKLYAERAFQAYGRRYGVRTRIGRFENCYGPFGAWRGGREKVVAALCRKIAEAGDGGTIEVWGDGSAVRSFVYVDDLVDGILVLMRSDVGQPANIGCDERVTVTQLVKTIESVAGVQVGILHVDGPVGVTARNFSHARMASLGWRPRHSLAAGIARTYSWVAEQVACARPPPDKHTAEKGNRGSYEATS